MAAIATPPVSVIGGSILLGVASSAIWEWARDAVSITSTKYIDIRGNWEVCSSYKCDGAPECNLNEKLIIKQQFGRRFRGIILSPHPTIQSEIIELQLRGEFKDKFHAVYSYEHRLQKLTDYGAGVLLINTDHISGEGSSVNLGISSPSKPAIVQYKIRRESKHVV